MVEGFTVRLSGNVPLLRMDRSVKLAQHVLNRMVVFPPSPLMRFPLGSCRVAVTVMVVTPTETQLPCQQHIACLATVNLINPNFYTSYQYLMCNIYVTIKSQTFFFSSSLIVLLPFIFGLFS